MKRVLRLGGHDFPVVRDAEVPRRAVLLCCRASIPLLAPENLVGSCGICRRGIQWNPSSPQDTTKLCLDCGTDLPGYGQHRFPALTESQASYIRTHLRKEQS